MMRRFTPATDSLLGAARAPAYLRWQAGVQPIWVVALIQVTLHERGFAWSWFAPTLVSIGLYLPLYLRVFIGPRRHLPWLAGSIAVIGFALLPFNQVAIGYLVTTSILLAYAERPRVWLIGTVLIAAVTYVERRWLDSSTMTALVVLGSGLLGGFSNFLYMSNLRKDAELRLSQGDVRRLATLAERERIGRDLHDLLGHTLSLVALKSELARRLAIADPARAQREMEEVERVARHALAEVRAAVTGMRRSDLAAELVSARLMLEASGVTFEASLPDTLNLPETVEASLALVLREAVTNIHRHAHATTARIIFSSEPERFVMQIHDDGRGGLADHGNGVTGMRERVRALGGVLQIDSPMRRGTAIVISVPLAARMAARRPPAAGREVA
jgi:two-component system sensor histidine kinase DesK